MNNKYKHLSLEERERLYALKEQGLSFRKISKIVNRDHRTLEREYKRNRLAGQKYIPCKAQIHFETRSLKQRSGAPLKDLKIYLYVKDKLVNNGWTPEQIAGRLSLDYPDLSICHESIYRYIYGKGRKDELWKLLPQMHKKRKRVPGRNVHKATFKSRIPDAIGIDQRPKKVDKRRQFGHLETDDMVGNKGSKTSLSATIERKYRYTLLSKMINQNSETKKKVLTKQLKSLESIQRSNKPVVRSVTSDNGSENTKHKEMASDLNTEWYFCRPYHSWEKGSVERAIKEVRRYIPKGTNLNKYSKDQIQWVENRLNSRPMKCLGWLSPKEAMEQEVNKYKFRSYQMKKDLVDKKLKWGTSK